MLDVGQQPERGRVIVRGGGGGRGLQLDRGRLEERDRVFVAGARGVLNVVRAWHGAGAAAFQLGGGTVVCAEPPATGGRDVDRVAHHRVAEREAARRARWAHQRSHEQLVERVQRGGLGQLGDRGGQARLERIACHGGRFKGPAYLRRERGELGRERRGDGGRHRAAAVRGRTVRGERDAGQLLEVERVAAGPRIDRARALSDELGRFGPAQRPERQRRESVIALGAGERSRQRGGHLALARGEREQHGGGGRPADQRRQRLDRCRISPLHVVHPHDQPARGGKPFERVT